MKNVEKLVELLVNELEPLCDGCQNCKSTRIHFEPVDDRVDIYFTGRFGEGFSLRDGHFTDSWQFLNALHYELNCADIDENVQNWCDTMPPADYFPNGKCPTEEELRDDAEECFHRLFSLTELVGELYYAGRLAEFDEDDGGAAV